MLGVTLGSLYVDTQVYVPALLKNLHGMSCSEAYWLLGGGWFWCRYGGFWMVSYYLMFHVVWSGLYSGVLWFLFIVKILPSGWCWTIGLSWFPG